MKIAIATIKTQIHKLSSNELRATAGHAEVTCAKTTEPGQKRDIDLLIRMIETELYDRHQASVQRNEY